jgi:TM2 domain-containing membrane protein YozV
LFYSGLIIFHRMGDQAIIFLAGLDFEESLYIKKLLLDMEPEQQSNFIQIYAGKRRDPILILVCILAGFLCFAGLHRFITERVGLGIAYFFTGGFLLIGTIIDLFRYKKIARKYNIKMAARSFELLGVWKN